MERFDLGGEYFLEISQKCRYNERMAEWYSRMADMEFDVLYPLAEREEARYRRWSSLTAEEVGGMSQEEYDEYLEAQSSHSFFMNSMRGNPEYRRMNVYSKRAESIKNCMRSGWVSDYYRLSGVKVVKSVNRCKDRFCYNCQSMDSLQRFHEYAPLIDRYSTDYDIYHVVLSQPNVPGFLLDQTLDLMYKGFSRLIGYMSGKKKIRGMDLVTAYGFEGCVRSLEVSQNDKDAMFHPHLHCLFVMKKGIDITPRHRNMFTKDRTHRREDRLFSDFEVFLQRIWYLLMNEIKVTKKNLDSLPQQEGMRTYPDGFSCYAEPACGHYHEVFKYATKGSFSNRSILNDFDCFLVLYKALYHRRAYQTYGCFYGIDMNELHDDAFSPGDLADMCFQELVGMLNSMETPLIVVENLLDILRVKISEENQGVRYLSVLSIRRAFDEATSEERKLLKEKIVRCIWNSCS